MSETQGLQSQDSRFPPDPFGLRQVVLLGKALDRGEFPVAHTDGILCPADVPQSFQFAGLEKKNDSGRKRSATESRQWSAEQSGAAGESREAGQPGTPDSRPPLLGGNLESQDADDLGALVEAYPATVVQHVEDGTWLTVKSLVISGLPMVATFLLALPRGRLAHARAWGFWVGPNGSSWIGPRHTNFPDGSICAFDKRDGSWKPEFGVIPLIDMYTLWAFRHLHLAWFGRWPGPQSAPHPYERLAELRDGESCGCDHPMGTYRECCKAADESLDRQKLAWSFLIQTDFGRRQPPSAIIAVMEGSDALPSIREVFRCPQPSAYRHALSRNSMMRRPRLEQT